MEDIVEDAKKVEKLYKDVVEENLRLREQEPIKIWLRPLSYPIEKAITLGVYRETYKLMIEAGQSEKDAEYSGYMAMVLQTLFFVIRKGPEDKSPRLFESTRKIGSVMPDEQNRLFEVFHDSFEMTEEELGNSLRARTN